MIENQNYNYDIMAIGAHPDDIEHTIGGTLLHLRDKGKKIVMVHMTHGEAGTYGDRETRDNEARACADYLGADVRWLDFEDTRITDSFEARVRLVTAIRDIRPRLILCQYYEYPLMHPDHEATGQIVRGAFRLCRFKNVETGQPVFWIPNIAYYLHPEHVKPTFVVDVTPYYDRWVELANLYGSQLDSIPGYKDRLTAKKRYAGGLIDTTYGESFYCDRPVKGNAVDLTLL
ncbi:MAG: PIG-L family deacetylase [Candidatus Sumerlaeaceae bacterium]|nr:PIG-L family deacetylase [Candidatus Sumerlaeaceae bacterium]